MTDSKKNPPQHPDARSLEFELQALRNDRQGLLDLVDNIAGTHLKHDIHVNELEQTLLGYESREQMHMRDLALYSSLFEFAPLGYVLLDMNGVVLKFNRKTRELCPQINKSQPFRTLVDTRDHRAFRTFLLTFVRLKEGEFHSINLRSSEGRSWTLHAARITVSGVSQLQLMIYDVSAITELENSLIIANSVLQQMREAVIITETGGRILRVNQTFSEITGYREDEVIGKTPAMLSSGRHGPAFYDTMWKALNDMGWWSGEIWNRRKGGEVYPQWLNISRIHDEANNRKLFVAVFSDITRRKQEETRLDRMAHYDTLTGLPNRSLFMGLVEHSINRARRNVQKLAMVFIDLDKFKQVNDNHGHHEGDILLQEAAQRISSCIRDSDIVARLGGDEFVVVLENITRNQAREVCQKLIHRLSEPFGEGERLHRLGASLGMALYPDHGLAVDDLLRRADAAMYKAKENGRNQLIEFEQAIEALNQLRNATEKLIYKAIQEQRIRVHFQPVVDAQTLNTAAVEALVRIEDEHGQLIYPDGFIDAAEHSGLIRPLGQEVFRVCCAFAAMRRSEQRPCPRIFVNLSARQLQDEKLVEQILTTAHQHQVPLTQFGFEITESSAMEDLGVALALIQQLRSEGALISLDDFGTGYASLSYLSELPLDVVKLDRSFITDIAAKPVNQAIVRAVVEIATLSGLMVTAEGVEDATQCDLIQALHVGHIQGYYFSRPLAAEALITWLEQKDGTA